MIVNHKIVDNVIVNQKKVNKVIDNNKKNKSVITDRNTVIRYTFPNDNKTIEPSVIDLLKNKLKYKKLFLVGDKGYASTESDKKNLSIKYNIELVYPYRKNQKDKTPKKHKVYLRKRYVIVCRQM